MGNMSRHFPDSSWSTRGDRPRQHAYGMRIRSFIEERTGRRVLIGSVYLTLDELKEKGYVKSWLGEKTPERGGRLKEHFEIDAAGRAAFYKSQRNLTLMLRGECENHRWKLK